MFGILYCVNENMVLSRDDLRNILNLVVLFVLMVFVIKGCWLFWNNSK